VPPEEDLVDDPDYDDDGQLDVEWYPIPSGLEGVWDEV
jgi:hypothetical protein